MAKIIDLHIHTNKSDGALSPKEVIDTAKKNGLYAISITDNDTTEAYTDDLISYAKEQGIKLINGVEISTKTEKAGIHVLGYNFDLNDKKFKNKLSKIRNARHDYLLKVSKKLNELNYIVNTEELDKIDAVTKAHIALDIINNKANEKELISEFGHIPNKGEFIETIMNEGCKAYVKKEAISPKEAAELIRSASGIVVLAHPVAYSYEDNLSEKDIQKIIKDMKADGIESNYIYIDRNNTKHNDINMWTKFANKLNLPKTIGSDFHNDDALHPVIGLLNEDINLDDNEIENILSFVENKN